MKVLNLIIEIITAPFSFILRTSESRKFSLSSIAKPLVILLVSLLIVSLFVLFFYSDVIFS